MAARSAPLIYNEIEIGNHSYSSLGIAIQNAGMDDLRVISDQFQDGMPGHATTHYYVLKDGPIQKIEDIKGKVVSSNAAGSAVDIAMRAMLKKHGLEDKRDYTHIEAPLPTMKAMLLGKKADLVPSVVPFQFDPELREKGRVLFVQREAQVALPAGQTLGTLGETRLAGAGMTRRQDARQARQALCVRDANAPADAEASERGARITRAS